MDDLRPPKTVEVACSYPGCGWHWWIDPLDPRLPEGPFDCGDNHQANLLVGRKFSLLRLRTGIHWGSMKGTGPEPPNCDRGSCGGDYSSGMASVWDRLRGTSGLLRWDSLAELRDVDAIPSRIEWGKPMPGDLPDLKEVVPPGSVRWVGYRLMATKGSRKYTFVKCARPGCTHTIYVDLHDPNFKAPAGGYIVGGFGGGVTPEPPWWGKEMRCGDGLSTMNPQPCELIHSPVVAAFEAQTGLRWTMWTPTGVSFFDPQKDRYGTLTYRNREYFESPECLEREIFWGTFSELAEYLKTMRQDNDVPDILDEVEKHLNLPS
jgi:hypothetical protein